MDRVDHLLRVELAGRRYIAGAELEDCALLAGQAHESWVLLVARHKELTLRDRKARVRLHIAERSAFEKAEEAPRLAVGAEHAVSVAALAEAGLLGARTAVAKHETRIRAVVAKAEVAARVLLIQHQSDLTDSFIDLWPAIRVLNRSEAAGREAVEEEEAKAFEPMWPRMALDRIYVPFQEGARRAMQRIEAYKVEHYCAKPPNSH
jgi:hypothetical protein